MVLPAPNICFWLIHSKMGDQHPKPADPTTYTTRAWGIMEGMGSDNPQSSERQFVGGPCEGRCKKGLGFKFGKGISVNFVTVQVTNDHGLLAKHARCVDSRVILKKGKQILFYKEPFTLVFLCSTLLLSTLDLLRNDCLTFVHPSVRSMMFYMGNRWHVYVTEQVIKSVSQITLVNMVTIKAMFFSHNVVRKHWKLLIFMYYSW